MKKYLGLKDPEATRHKALKCDIMSDDDAEKLFLQEKPTLALLFIGSMEKTYASVISKEIDSTFAHTTRILTKMEQCGLIRFTFEGRIKFVELTEYGREVETALNEFRNIIREAAPDKDTVAAGMEAAVGSVSEESPKSAAGKEAEEAGELEKIKELDPVNKEILEKIRNLREKIESIHREALEQGDSKDMVFRKLGPYSRDVKKLRNMIETAESPIDEMVEKSLEESSNLLESYLKR